MERAVVCTFRNFVCPNAMTRTPFDLNDRLIFLPKSLVKRLPTEIWVIIYFWIWRDRFCMLRQRITEILHFPVFNPMGFRTTLNLFHLPAEGLQILLAVDNGALNSQTSWEDWRIRYLMYSNFADGDRLISKRQMSFDYFKLDGEWTEGVLTEQSDDESSSEE